MASDKDARYIYSPLEHGQTRVLEFDDVGSLDSSEPIRCRLKVVDVPGIEYEWTQYRTLSYVWGESSADESHLTCTILCDGRTLKITQNLYAALRHLLGALRVRPEWANEWTRAFSSHFHIEYSRLPIWIDAICINQKDAQEKSHQIALMARIYSCSQRLLIWLGDALAFEEEQALSDLFDGRWRQGEMVRNLRAARQLRALFDRPWFGRRWIVQETLATEMKKRWMVIGSTVVKVERLLELVQPVGLPGVEDQIKLLSDTGMGRNSWLTNAELYTNSECADPKDRLFALINISRDRYRCTSNYEQEWRDIYKAFAHRHIDQQSIMGLLVAAARRRRLGEPTPGLPSWVPDWQKRGTIPDDMPPFGNGDTASLAFEFDVLPGDILSLEGHLLRACDHDESDQEGSCTCCTILSAYGMHAKSTDFPVLCLKGATVSFAVRLVEGAHDGPRYTLERCFRMGQGWALDDPRKWFKEDPVMHLIV